MLIETHIELLLEALRTNEIDFAITALGLFPASRSYADAAQLLEQCSSHRSSDKERLRILLADLISRYPHVLWAIPVLIDCRTADIGMLTLPEIDASDVSENAVSARWLPINRDRSIDSSPNRDILTNRTGCALLVVQTDGTDSPVIDDNSLARIFAGCSSRGALCWGIGPVLCYPEGIEAGFLMNAIVHRSDGLGLPNTPRYFLQDQGWRIAVEASLIYREREPTLHRTVQS